MDSSQKKFLQERLRNAAIDQPDLERLKTPLLKFRGEFLVAPPKFDADVTKLLDAGFLMNGPIIMKQMEPTKCHQNVAAIWRARKKDIVGIATGYALADDGLWRQHSWGLLRDGVFETTEKNIKYFGVLLQGSDADYFAECNPY